MIAPMLQVLAPLALLPVLLWLLVRYKPALAGVGRGRIYLLVLLGCAAIGAQVGALHTQGYPFVTWMMYSDPTPSSTTWRFVAVGPDGERDFPWTAAAPLSSVRGFQRNFTNLASELEAAEDDGERAQVRARLDGKLGELAAIKNQRRPDSPVRTVRVERCRMDIHDPRPRDRVACSTVHVVRVESRASRDGGSPGAVRAP